MRKLLAIAAIVSIPLMLGGTVWQTTRSSALVAELRRLESLQEEWLRENEKLEAGIAVLASRERAAELARALGLEIAKPSSRLRVELAKPATGRIDG